MGNISSAPSSSTNTLGGRRRDVFISFRGDDTRYSFTNYLYEALRRKHIETFMDDQLVRGDEISPALLQAIEESKISVVVFSKNYASSKWCLDELVKILECKKVNGQIVVPIFYDVDPSDVGKQKGSFEKSFDEYEKQFSQTRPESKFVGKIVKDIWKKLNHMVSGSAIIEHDMFVKMSEKVQRWRVALREASNLSGWDSSLIRPDSRLVGEIVKDILKKLMNQHISSSSEFEGLVGIEEKIDRIISLLCLDTMDFRIIGIWGMGGIGKTTIVDAVFKLISGQFEASSFTRNVRKELENSEGPDYLQRKILSEVLQEENLKLANRTVPPFIKEMLSRKKVFIILDDVDNFRKLKNLVGGINQFGAGSRILMTCRDKQVLHNCGVNDQNMYEVEGLNYHEAFELFSNHAFKQSKPNEDFMELSIKLVNYAAGNPLALEVLGLALYGKSKQVWESAVHQLQRIFNPEILDVLKISYDGLDDEGKNLFLDIACLFNPCFMNISVDYIVRLLCDDCYFSLDKLVDKSLVKIQELNVSMHDLLREMGKEIVRKESPDNPSKRNWLCYQEDILHMLKNDTGTNVVRGIVLFSSNIKDDIHLSSQVFEKMPNIRILRFPKRWKTDCKLRLPNGLNCLPNELRSLEWRYYPLEALPSNINLEKLVELDLSCSNIEQLWEGAKDAPKLRLLKLSYCRHLIRIPDLLHFPLIKEIDLKDCDNLLDIHSSVQHLELLSELILKGCKSLRSFPSNIHVKFLSELDLSGCINLTKFPQISGDIEVLDLSRSAIDKFPSIQSLTKLRTLNLSKCTELKHFPKLSGLQCPLTRLNLRGCNLKEIPEDIGHLSLLVSLDLGVNEFESLPKSMKQLSNMRTLFIDRCNMLQSLTEIPSHLVTLIATNCKRLRSIPDASEFVEWFITQYGMNDHKKYSYGPRFTFTNCLNLDEKAFSNILERLINQRIAMKVFSRVEIGFCYPGSRFPVWFPLSYQASGSSIDIDIPGHDDDDFNGQILGFAVCAVIEAEECLDLYFSLSVSCSCINHHETYRTNWEFQNIIHSDHVVLGYFDIPVSKETNFKFDFEFSPLSCRVKKYCGVLPLFDNANAAQPRFKAKSFAVQPTYAEVSGINIRDIAETSKKRKRKRFSRKEILEKLSHLKENQKEEET